MKRLQILLALFLGVLALAMSIGSLSAQQLWKTSWSPDGKSIAFGDGADIWKIDSDGGVAVNLTLNIDEDCSCPVFSSDGEEIIYSALFASQAFPGDGWTSNVIAANLLNGGTRPVLENAYAASFSPDGRLVTYIRDWVNYVVYDFQTNSEKVYDFNNSAPPFFSGGHSFLSPDNSYFVTRLKYGNNTPLSSKYKLYRVAIETGEAELIDIDDKNYIYPKYSPDGASLLFSQAGADEVYQLVIYDIASGDIIPIEDTGSAETKCGSWSPDGLRICYVKNDSDVSELYVYDIRQDASRLIHTKSVTGATLVEKTAPLSIVLFTNYPNPFNPSTTIEFSLEHAGDVRLDVFNIMGQKILRLVSQDMEPGFHSVVWNGRDENGNSVSSGMYVCRLLMGEQVVTRQMMLAR